MLCRLQIDELLDIYDTEVSTQKELGRCWRASYCSPRCAFVGAAPLKVLMEVGRLFYGKLDEDGWAVCSAPVNENGDPRKRGHIDLTVLSSTGVGSLSSSEVTEGQASKRPRLHSGTTSLCSDAEYVSVAVTTGDQEGVVESLGPAVKATKNDDAKVVPKQWDIWSVDNFQPVNSKSGMVCVAGSYCEHQHGHLFDCLQGLAVRWYRKRTLRSFLKYLREQHGRRKTSDDEVEINGRPRKF